VSENVFVATAFGGSFGALLGYMRSQNIAWYAVSMGLNYAVFSGTFFGACEGVKRDVEMFVVGMYEERVERWLGYVGVARSGRVRAQLSGRA
jgi:hypothetical protein